MIVITGMQRSGTSLVCQLLAGLGTSFGDPKDLLTADRWNPAGYFEAKPVMDVNSKIITGLPRIGSRPGEWLAKLAYLGMPSAAAIAERAERHRGTIEELGRRYQAGAIKDPRLCMTLGYWCRWTDVRHVVVCMRHPDAVTASLARRHRMPRWLGARFFAWHVDALIGQLAALPAVFVDVDALVARRADELDTLRSALGLVPGPPSAHLLADVVKPELFELAGNDADPRLDPALAAWRRLVELAATHRRPAARADGG